MRLIMFGPPGAGKGTQARLIMEKTGVPQIAAGDLFREHIRNDTELGRQVDAIMKEGRLVPDEVTIQMIGDRLHQSDCEKGFILDGFPRNVVQAIALDKMLEEKGLAIDSVIKINVDDEKLIERIAGRFTCGECNEGYHDTFKKPAVEGVCDKCGATGDFRRRSDDDPVALRARLEEYHEKTAPMIPYYEQRGRLDHVDGMADIEDVTRQIGEILERRAP